MHCLSLWLINFVQLINYNDLISSENRNVIARWTGTATYTLLHLMAIVMHTIINLF